jgi:formiminoglutamase
MSSYPAEWVRQRWEWPGNDPPVRFADTVVRDAPEGCRVALLGLPDDTGVRMNGGRPGAVEGPMAFRSALARYGTARPDGWNWPPVYDAGDVVPGFDLKETHERVTQVTDSLLAQGLLPVGIGGGHDLTFAFVRALARRIPSPLTAIYLDAHLDVRREPGSGMPFRALVEECGVEALHVLGLDPLANSAEHMAWFREHGGQLGTFEPDDPWPGNPDDVLFVSLDLDVLDQAHAPGVSAMNPAGWSPGRTIAYARAAGRDGRVGCFDLMELSPPWDESGRTARLAARLFLAFLQGVGERTGSGGQEP